MHSYISAYMVPGKAKIATKLMPFQLHQRRSHDRLFASFGFIGLWDVSGLICGKSPRRDPDMGNQSSHVDIADNINSRRTEIMREAQTNDAVPSLTTQTIFINGRRVACNGVGGPLGHPQVWLTLGSNGQVTCPYCSRNFAAAPQADGS